ncbi:MAG TPA: 3-methyl-2-oxobutanoate hydroxymethyltransferase [Nitrospiria bacterium]|nr:3-methyl-2-oxobutanoate hydroxymethyltransferase [Nitrospiria bacterium]
MSARPPQSQQKRVTVPLVREAKGRKKLTMVTAYDAPSARIVDEAGVDVALVGDSLGMVIQGRADTLGVTLEQMVYHTEIVARSTARALVVGDMPFLTFQISNERTIEAAGQLIRAGAAAVKLEGGGKIAERIRAVTEIGIPVMAHLGLTPQSLHQMGGYKVQGRDAEAARRLLDEAKRVQDAGAFAVVLEGMPAPLAKQITDQLSIPTIGIGAGLHCDGQVLVFHDLVGLSGDRTPTFVRRYADLRVTAVEAVKKFKADVEAGKFPSEGESYK